VAALQVIRGRLSLVEVDSFSLPDTAGTAYRSAHVKTTVAVNEIDIGPDVLMADGVFIGDRDNYAELNKALATPSVRDKLPEMGLEIVGGTPEQYAAHIKSEAVKWADVVKRSGAKVD